LRLLPATKGISILSKVLNGASLCESEVEVCKVRVVYLLVEFSLALVNGGRGAIAGIRTEEQERFARV
jgi:hypothetical protein